MYAKETVRGSGVRASSTATRPADKGAECAQETKMKRVDASGTTRPIGFGKTLLQAATGRMISKNKGIAGILSTLLSPQAILNDLKRLRRRFLFFVVFLAII